MGRQHIGKDGDQHHGDDHHEAGDGALVGAEITPELPQGMRRSGGRDPAHGGIVDHFGGHR
jgi:hypothetical protein